MVTIAMFRISQAPRASTSREPKTDVTFNESEGHRATKTRAFRLRNVLLQ